MKVKLTNISCYIQTYKLAYNILNQLTDLGVANEFKQKIYLIY